MALFELQPSVALQEFIRVYRIVHFVFDSKATLPFKAYPPRAEHCLSFYPKDTETVSYTKSATKISNLKSVLMGQQSEITNRFVGNDFLVFQIVFRPGALFRITGIPSYELTNSYIDAETIFPKEIKNINEQLHQAKDYIEMKTIIESFLWRQVQHQKKEAHRLDVVCNSLLNATQNFSIDSQAQAACLSPRQFERKFVERMGVSPKYFSKIIRFESTFRMKNKYPHYDWLTIALQCGYYDYQHLAKDYKELTHHTPAAFHVLDLNSPERKFGEADTY